MNSCEPAQEGQVWVWLGPASTQTLGLLVKCIYEQRWATCRLQLWESLEGEWWSKSPEGPLHVVWFPDRSHKTLINSLCCLSEVPYFPLQQCKTLPSASCLIDSHAPGGTVNSWLSFSISVILSAQWVCDVCLSLLIRAHEMSVRMESWTERLDSWSASREPSKIYSGGGGSAPRWPRKAGHVWACTVMLKGLHSLGACVSGRLR